MYLVRECLLHDASRAILQRRNVIGKLPLPFQLIACFLRTNFVHITLDIMIHMLQWPNHDLSDQNINSRNNLLTCSSKYGVT